MPMFFLLALWKRGYLSRKLFGLLRAAAYVSVVALVSVTFLVTRAKAQLRQQSMALGKELSPIADLLDGATALRVNGQTLNFSMSFRPELSVKDALDRVQAQCDEQPGPLTRELRAIAAELPKVIPAGQLLDGLIAQTTTTRQESENEGALLCFTGNGAQAAFADEFEKTNDLAALGRLRYVRVDRDPTEKDGLTRITALWTEDSLTLESFQPPAFGDAPGSDSAMAPRPPKGIRIFSAEAVGSTYAVRLYETDLAPEEVLAFYDHSMAGWEVLTMPGYEKLGRGYVKDSRPLLVQVSRDESKTLVSLSEAGGLGAMDKLLR